MGEEPSVVLDTNVFVGAGFRRHSASARILEHVRSGDLRLVWNDDTFGETCHIVRKIPPLRWPEVEGLFREENRYDGPAHPDRFPWVPDPEDRKFLALAAETGATLVTSDDHLLSGRENAPVSILTPGEFLRRHKPAPSEKTD